MKRHLVKTDTSQTQQCSAGDTRLTYSTCFSLALRTVKPRKGLFVNCYAIIPHVLLGSNSRHQGGRIFGSTSLRNVP